VPDIVNGCRYQANCYLHNYTTGAIVVDVNWEILNSLGVAVSSGTYNDLSVPAGDWSLAWFIYLPQEPQEGCTLSLTIEGGSPEAVISNEFAVVEVTLNHIDTVSNISIGNTLIIHYEVTAAAECYSYIKAWIRDSNHNRMLLGYYVGTIAAGTSHISHSIIIPSNGAYIGTDYDVEVAKVAEPNTYYGNLEAIVSNHFNITA
jgi:hypothetical protein